MEAITVSVDRFPAYTAEDAALLALKNGVLVEELDACEAENARLRKIVVQDRQRQNQIYNVGIESYYGNDTLCTFERICYFVAGAVFSAAILMVVIIFAI